MSSESRLRDEIVRYGRLMYERQLTYATGGNISARVGDSTVLITPSGVRKGDLGPPDLIKLSLEGEVRGGGRPSIETPLHLLLYRRRPEVGAVVHGHPPFCTTLAVLSRELRISMIPEGVLVLKEVPLLPYETPGTEELASAVAGASDKGFGCLLQNHGAFAWGRDLEEAYNRLEEMEFLAMVQVRAEAIGTPNELSDPDIEALRQLE